MAEEEIAVDPALGDLPLPDCFPIGVSGVADDQLLHHSNSCTAFGIIEAQVVNEEGVLGLILVENLVLDLSLCYTQVGEFQLFS